MPLKVGEAIGAAPVMSATANARSVFTWATVAATMSPAASRARIVEAGIARSASDPAMETGSDSLVCPVVMTTPVVG